MILKPSKIDENLNLLYPSSHCSICKKPIRFYENIPILSYLIVRGKCSNCNNKISLQYPIVEIVTAVVTLHTSKHFNLGFDFIAILLFCYLLISITVIDFNHKIVPDILSFSLIISGITISCIFYLEGNKDILTDPISSIIGILFGYFLPFVIYKFHYSFTGKEGMGHGDFKLLAGLGAWLGWKTVPIVLFFAAITGLIYAFYLFVSKKIENDSLIPFAHSSYPVINATSSVRLYNPYYSSGGYSGDLGHEVGHVWGLGHAAGIMFYLSTFYSSSQYQMILRYFKKVFVPEKDAMHFRNNRWIGDTKNYIYLNSGYAGKTRKLYKEVEGEKIIMQPVGKLSYFGFSEEMSSENPKRLKAGFRPMTSVPSIVYYFQPKNKGKKKYNLKVVFKKERKMKGSLMIRTRVTPSIWAPFLVNHKRFSVYNKLSKSPIATHVIDFATVFCTKQDKNLPMPVNIEGNIYEYEFASNLRLDGDLSHNIYLQYVNGKEGKTKPLHFVKFIIEKAN